MKLTLLARDALFLPLSPMSKIIICAFLAVMVGLVVWMVSYRRPGPGPDLRERPED